jgi:hypothetical protein
MSPMTSTPTLPVTHQVSSADGLAASNASSIKTANEVMSKDKGPPAGHSQQGPLALGRPRFWAIFLGLMMCIFLFALGQS